MALCSCTFGTSCEAAATRFERGKIKAGIYLSRCRSLLWQVLEDLQLGAADARIPGDLLLYFLQALAPYRLGRNSSFI